MLFPPTVLQAPTLAAVLDSLVKLFAVIGGVSVAVAPFLIAWLKLRVHDAVKDAPAIAAVNARVDTVERWQTDHGDDVKAIPRLATALERIEGTLDRLTGHLIAKGLQ